MDRRLMLQNCLALGTFAWTCSTNRTQANDAAAPRFTLDLCPGRIGVQMDQMQTIQAAQEFGFQSVEPVGRFLASLDQSQLENVRDSLTQKGLVWGAAGLPVSVGKDTSGYRADLKKLPKIAAALGQAGVTRVGTWLSPSHGELTYRANFKRHVQRLRDVAKILGDSGLRLGLEYIGPKTLWASKRFPFVHSMVETKELLAEIDKDNVGFVLDSWHWYTAGETPADITSLTNDDVVAVDLNDAPRGIPRDEQIDSRRELPLASGVIDLKAFLSALVQLGYDGPIRAEPFNQKLNAMDNSSALRATAEAMTKAFSLVAS